MVQKTNKKVKARSYKRPDSKTGEMQTINTSVFTEDYNKLYKVSSKSKQSIAYHIRIAIKNYLLMFEDNGERINN